MDTRLAALIAILTILAVAGCAAAPAATTSPTVAPPPTAALTQEPLATPTTTPVVTHPPATSAASPCADIGSDTYVLVNSRANIFGAGHEEPPAPGSGGAGILPPLVDVDIGPGSLVTFPCASGLVDCCAGSGNTSPAGPEGAPGWSTDIESYGGISGIIHGTSGVFLAGVFLGQDEPYDPAPERLDFSDTCPLECTFEVLEPELGQIFYIGPGGETPVYVAPDGATRLFVGLPDAMLVNGPPGWYSNNSGEFQVAVEVQ